MIYLDTGSPTTIFIGWFTNHLFLSKGLASFKGNHLFFLMVVDFQGLFFEKPRERKPTPPKIHEFEPENDGLEDVSPFPGVYSQVPC